MKKIVLLIIAVSVISCNSNKLYQRIKNDSIIVTKEKEPLNKILSLLNDSIAINSHIIYVYKPINRLPMFRNKDFTAMVYNYGTNSSYYFINKNIDRYVITSMTDKEKTGLLNFVIKNYLENNLKHLELSQNLNDSEGGSGRVFLYDIDLEKKTVKEYYWTSIDLDGKGKPTH